MGIAGRLALGMALGGATAMTAVLAQDVKPERAIKYRQGIMQAQGWNTRASWRRW
jgi:hypothetical protein